MVKKNIHIPVIEFAYEAVDKIESLVNKSIHDEFGGVLCLDVNNKIYLENVVKGGAEGIDRMPEVCDEGNKRIGTFHTHPKYDPEGDLSVERISMSDYNFHEVKKDTITCIGHAATKKLTCMISSVRTDKEKKDLDYLISELGEAEVAFQMLTDLTRKEADIEITKEGHYDKINKYYNWLNVDLSEE